MTSRKQIAVLTVIALGLGGYGLYRLSHGTASAAGTRKSPPEVVTVQEGHLRRMTVHRYVDGYGVVDAAPATPRTSAAAAAIAAPMTGVVTKVEVTAGQRVHRGQLLALLNSKSMTEQYVAQEVARLKRLYAQHNASLKALQNAEAQLALLRVKTPISGTVVKINVKPGTGVTATTVLAEVMDLDRLVVRTDIPEPQAGELRTGQRVEIHGTRLVSGRLSFVSSTVDPSDGAVMAWASLPPASGLKVGQYVNLRIVTATHTHSLVAPRDSVISDLSGHSTVSLIQGNEAIRVPVEAGLRESKWVKVTGPGLTAGMPVVTVGAYGLPGRVAIRVKDAR